VVQSFHDPEDSGGVNNPGAPLAHAGLRVQYLNRRVGGEP
jgi:hypothetical protein